MFSRLFAENGLSLDRLKALLAVGAAGSIVKAADGDAVKQSQYSRQIKELEDFFRIRLIERHGKGIRLTPNGRELARISRFFMLGLSNFQRGCLADEQAYRIGASATIIHKFLLPVLSKAGSAQSGARFIVETVGDDDMERRLHDLTLDFGVTMRAAISRPLQLKEVGKWRLALWAPRAVAKTEKIAVQAFNEHRLPIIYPERELRECGTSILRNYIARLICEDFLQVMAAMQQKQLGGILPTFLNPNAASNTFVRVPNAAIDSCVFRFHLAWNPRMLRLNPHAIRRRDILAEALSGQITGQL